MATYGDMQTRIADELDRTDLTAQIRKAIVSAVEFYEPRQFYGVESSFTFVTSATVEIYGASYASAISTAPAIERININYNGARTPILKTHWEQIDDKSSYTTNRAQPEEWAYRAEGIRFYPIPDAAYTATVYHTARLTALSTATDSNFWTNRAEELIRTRAKIDLMRNVIRGPEMASEIAFLQVQEREALTALIDESGKRRSTGFIRPTLY